MLFVEGFKDVESLSDRVVELFVLCSKMLSPQRHYDWGLRELKTILTACGNALRAIRLNEADATATNTDKDRSQTTMTMTTTAIAERDVIASVLRTSISSKLTVPDSNVFNLLMSIIFPSANARALEGPGGQVLIDGLTRTFQNLGLAVNNRQLGKCVELYDQLTKRMGVMVVGRPGTGKTTLINALRQTLVEQMGQQIRAYTISPKSMSLQHFLGQLDVDTRQWQDGVLTATAQTVVAVGEAHVTSWIICDGDVDPVWIEALNSVLDDNKLLTLPSGWRIQFGANVNFLFETHDLQHASPATISRTGIINVNPEDFPETMLVDRFNLSTASSPDVVGQQEEQNQEVFRLFIEKYLWRAIDWLEQRATEQWRNSSHESRVGNGRATATEHNHGFMPFPGVVGRSNWINWALQAIQNQNNHGHGTEQDNKVSSAPGSIQPPIWSKERFCMVLVNSLGCALPTLADKVAFIKAIMNEWMELSRLPCTEDQLVNLYLDQRRQELDVYRGGQDVVANTNGPGGGNRALIRTPQIQGYLDVLQDFIYADSQDTAVSPCPFLVIGPSGSAKTLLVEEVINEANSSSPHHQSSGGYQLIPINCSAQLSADHIRHVLRENMVVTAGPRGREYRPKLRRTIVLLKNLNLLRVDCYGSSDVIELVLEIVYRSGFYATTTNDWITVSGLQFGGTVTLADPSATEFNKISPRLLNLCRYLIVGQPSAENLQMIITLQLKCLPIANWKAIRAEAIARTVLAVFSQLKERLETTRHSSSASPRRWQYEFSPKLMSRTITNLQRYPEQRLTEAVAFELGQIFRNRLSTAEDVKTFDEILSASLLLAGNGDIQSTMTTTTSAFLPTGSGEQQWLSRDEQRQLVERHIEVCNNEDIQIEVPVTDTLLDNVLAVARVCCQSGAHLMLCGAVGGGRRETVHIAAQLMQFKLHAIQAVRNYGQADFFNDLKAAMQSSALEDAKTVLLVDFAWLNHCPQILVVVEAILEGSDIPELFGDELENVAAPLKQAANNDNYGDSLAAYFMERKLS